MNFRKAKSSVICNHHRRERAPVTMEHLKEKMNKSQSGAFQKGRNGSVNVELVRNKRTPVTFEHLRKIE